MYKLNSLLLVAIILCSNVAIANAANAKSNRSYLEMSRQQSKKTADSNQEAERAVVQGNIDGTENNSLLGIEDFPEEEGEKTVLTVANQPTAENAAAYRGAFDTFAEHQNEFKLFMQNQRLQMQTILERYNSELNNLRFQVHFLFATVMLLSLAFVLLAVSYLRNVYKGELLDKIRLANKTFN